MTVSEALNKIETKHFIEAAKTIDANVIPEREKIRDYYIEIPELGNKKLPPKYLTRIAYQLATNNKDISALNEMNSVEARRRIQQLRFGLVKQLALEAAPTAEINIPPKRIAANPEKIQIKMSNTISLNTILYGPPGTGKTYHTINKAVAIANPEFDVANSSREVLKAEYERLVKDNQIEFVTFHQSLSYEDFIEGIKPVEPKEGDEFLKYEIKDGIFKRLAERASKVPDIKPATFSISDDDFQKSSFYKLSLGDTSNPDDDQIYHWCIQNGYIALGWGDAIDFSGLKENEIQQMVPTQLEKFASQAVNYFTHYVKVGDYIVVTYGNLQLRAIGKVIGNYEFKNVAGLNVHQFRKVEWLLKDVELPYEEVYNKQFSQQSIYRLDKREIKQDFFVKASIVVPVDNKPKNYVLIIDEINRGNVSQIFGELITLIEEDKRSGNEEAISVTLPYSKKSFSVPANLYIIGTMNTADRSIEALDTALRRRFVFEEMIPNPNVIQEEFTKEFLQLCVEYYDINWDDPKWIVIEENYIDIIPKDGYNRFVIKYDVGKNPEIIMDEYRKRWLAANIEIYSVQIIKAVNQRIERLLNKEHLIGHSYFIGKYTWASLQSAFYKCIIPLLQEYFYGDYGKIGLVLGNGFVKLKTVNSTESVFTDFDYDASSFEDKIVYELVDYTTNSKHSIQYKNQAVEMTFPKAIKLLLKKDIE